MGTPVFFAKVTLKWEPAPFFGAALEAHYERSWNPGRQQALRAQVLAQFRF